MKLFLLFIVLICCFLIGFKIKNYFTARKTFFENLIIFCQNLKNKISYQNEKLELLIKEESNFNNNKIFGEFLKVYSSYVKQSLNQIDFKNKLIQQLTFLKEEEINTIFNFVIKIGIGFQDEELENITNFENWSKKHLENITSFNKKFANLYLKLFLILGVMIFIIFI